MSLEENLPKILQNKMYVCPCLGREEQLSVLKRWESGESRDLASVHGEGMAARLWALVETIARIIIQTPLKGHRSGSLQL